MVKRRTTDVRTLRELAAAVDKDRGRPGSLLTSALRQAANEIEELRGRLIAACEPCAECGHIDYRELDDMVPPRAEAVK